MRNAPLSSLNRKEQQQFWANVAMVIVIFAILMVILCAWFMVQEKVQVSQQQSITPVGSSNTSLQLPTTLGLPNYASITNSSLTPVPIPAPNPN